MIANYREKVFVTSAKKAYTTILATINTWNAQNEIVGDYEYFWTYPVSMEERLKMITKNMNVLDICIYDMEKCGGNHVAKQYKKLNDGEGNTLSANWFNANRAVLADGSFLSIDTTASNGSCVHSFWSNEKDSNGNFIPDSSSPTGFKGEYKSNDDCGYIRIDTNGLKGPNQVGIDCFGIQFFRNSIKSPDSMGNLNYVLANDKLINTENYTTGKFE